MNIHSVHIMFTSHMLLRVLVSLRSKGPVQAKTIVVDRDHSAHLVYLNSRTARDRFIVVSLIIFSPVLESLLLCNF